MSGLEGVGLSVLAGQKAEESSSTQPHAEFLTWLNETGIYTTTHQMLVFMGGGWCDRTLLCVVMLWIFIDVRVGDGIRWSREMKRALTLLSPWQRPHADRWWAPVWSIWHNCFINVFPVSRCGVWGEAIDYRVSWHSINDWSSEASFPHYSDPEMCVPSKLLLGSH